MAPDSGAPRRNPPAGQPHRPPSRWGDAALAVLVLVADAVVLAAAVAYFVVRSLPRLGAVNRTTPGRAGPEEAPAMDWTPVITFGAVAAVVLLTAWVFLRADLVITGTLQAVVAVLIVIAVIVGGARSWKIVRTATAHPGTTHPGTARTGTAPPDATRAPAPVPVPVPARGSPPAGPP
ncbi:hypothetical protein ACFYVL_29175 [Streptomyces sp. NPDC004111]|uniref:hypothetical protein n=1 Tax=Streptomyces sp. NPDC004111 TaxID=3364690 RepID=UPI0036C7D171